MINLLEQYWKILFSVFVLTGIGYFYLMRIKKSAVDNYYGVGDSSSWTPETRHDYLKNMVWYFKYPLLVQVIIFLFFDWFLNILLTLPMLDLPATFFELTTHRMKRYKKLVWHINRWGDLNMASFLDRWRYNVAIFICGLLNRGEKDHC